MNVNDYIRTNDGKIAKFIKYDEEDKNELVTDYYEYSTIWIGDIIKSSPNIIDLIEVGDYVNGYKVDYVGKPYEGWEKTIICNDYNLDDSVVEIKAKDIKSIVTKKQFSSMEYKL